MRMRRLRRLPAVWMLIVGIAIGAVIVSPVGAAIAPNIKKVVKKGDKKTLKKAVKKSLAQGDKRFAGAKLQYERSAVVTVDAGADGSAVATCPTGTSATGGGGAYPAATGVQILQSTPSNGTIGSAGFSGWEFRIRNGAGVPRNIRAYVICASVGGNTSGNYNQGDPTL
jgi:hypothetical protein